MALAGVLSPVMQGLIYLVTPFVVKVVYRCIGTPDDEDTESKDEQTPLLSDAKQIASPPEKKSRNTTVVALTASWRREVSSTTFAFTTGLAGVTYALLSQTVPHYTMGEEVDMSSTVVMN